MNKVEIGDKVVIDRKAYTDSASWEEAEVIGHSYVRGHCLALKSTSGTIYHVPVTMPLKIVAPRPKSWFRRLFKLYTYIK